jgi:hypothetical protein
MYEEDDERHKDFTYKFTDTIKTQDQSWFF